MFWDVVLRAIEVQKNITLAELSALLKREHGALFAISTVHRLLVAIVSRLRKAVHAAKQYRPDMARRRQAWTRLAPRWLGYVAGYLAASGAEQPCRTVTGNDDQGASG